MNPRALFARLSEEPSAVVSHAGICEGDAEQSAFLPQSAKYQDMLRLLLLSGIMSCLRAEEPQWPILRPPVPTLPHGMPKQDEMQYLALPALVGNKTYTFPISSARLRSAPLWDPDHAENPPISAATAAKTMSEAIKKIDLPDGYTAWRLSSLELLRTHDRNHWVWKANFTAVEEIEGQEVLVNGPNIGLPVFMLMDGTLVMPTPQAEQAGTGQPATRPESKSKGSDKPQPDAEGRSR